MEKLLFSCREVPGLTVAAEICEDLWAAAPPSVAHAMAGANVIVNLSASDETVGKADYRRELVKSQSARLLCAYIYATAGYGESTQDLVFGGQHLICENGVVLKEAEMFQNQSAEAVLDINRLSEERRRISTWHEEKRGRISYSRVFPSCRGDKTGAVYRSQSLCAGQPGRKRKAL